MLGQSRAFLPGVPAHVIQRCNGRKLCFYTAGDFGFYLSCLREACRRHGCLVHAYALLVNRVHLLVTPETEHSLPSVMHGVGQRYERWAGRRHSYSGPVWEGRYKCSLVDSTEYMLACQCHIEMAPVRSGVVGYPEDFQWSSYAANAGFLRRHWLSPHRRYLNLGKSDAARGRAYSKLFSVVEDDSEWITRKTLKGHPIGSDNFRRRLEVILGVTF